MRPWTEHVPKALVLFHGRPLLDHAVAHLVRSGIRRVAVNAHYLGAQVAHHVERVLAPAWPDVEFHVSMEPELLGTGGALKHLATWLHDEAFVVANADNVYEESVEALWRHHVASGADGTLLVTRDARARTMRRLMVDARGEVRGIVEPWADDAAVFCGVQVAEASILERLPAGPSCSLRAGYLPYLANGLRVCTYETRGFWADTGSPEAFADAEARVATAAPRVLASETPRGAALGPFARG